MNFMISADCAKMAAPLKACTKEEQCFAIHFPVSDSNKHIKIQCSMKLQYGIECLFFQQMYESVGSFSKKL
jgi:uncharacterized protein YjaZ